MAWKPMKSSPGEGWTLGQQALNSGLCSRSGSSCQHPNRCAWWQIRAWGSFTGSPGQKPTGTVGFCSSPFFRNRTMKFSWLTLQVLWSLQIASDSLGFSITPRRKDRLLVWKPAGEQRARFPGLIGKNR